MIRTKTDLLKTLLTSLYTERHDLQRRKRWEGGLDQKDEEHLNFILGQIDDLEAALEGTT